VNERFKSEGLYITHLFSEDQVFLRRNWLESIVPITVLRLNRLKLFRPATIGLVLTKMMRGRDPQDLADAEFMIRHDGITEAQMAAAFCDLKPIELIELRDAFEAAKPAILEIARTVRARRR
jgi:hypothetical protein